MKNTHNQEHYEVIAKDQSWNILIERSKISHDLWFCSLSPNLMNDNDLKKLLDNYRTFECTVVHHVAKRTSVDKEVDSIECGRISGDKWIISYQLIRSNYGFNASWRSIMSEIFAGWDESRVIYEIEKRKRFGDTIRYFDRQGKMIHEEKK